MTPPSRAVRPEPPLPPVCILAGGRGTRLGERAGGLPKPLVEVAGRPFLEHQLDLLVRHGAERAVLCVGYRGDLIEAALGDGARLGLRLDYVDDGAEPAGTAGALRLALPLLGPAFLVLYGDTYLRIDYRAVAAAQRGSGLPALMCVYRNAGRWDTSNVRFDGQRVVEYDKAQPPPGAEWIDYGLLALTPEALAVTPAPDLAEVTRVLATRGLLAGFEAPERFYEIGTPAALAETEAFLRAQAR